MVEPLYRRGLRALDPDIQVDVIGQGAGDGPSSSLYAKPRPWRQGGQRNLNGWKIYMTSYMATSG